MKRALSVLLALVMVVGFGSFTVTGVAATTGDDGDQGAWNPWSQGKGDIHKMAKMFKTDGQPAEDAPKEKEVIVMFADSDSPDVSSSEAATIEAVEAMAERPEGAKGASDVEIANGVTVNSDEVWEFGDSDEGDSVTVAVASSKKLDTEEMIQKLESKDMIEAISPNYRRHICNAGDGDSAGDGYSNYQWALGEYPGIDVEAGWASSTGSDENIVAVIDTGIYYKHPDLKGQMWSNPFGGKLKGKCGFDFVNSTPDNVDIDPEDDNGHGTHCAGIIGAATNANAPDKPGIQGVNQKISLMALKVLDEEGGGYDSDIIAAFNYVYRAMDLYEKDETKNGKIVAVSCSFGGEEPDDVMGEVIDKIGKKGAITVCAAGNEEENNDEVPSYPACYDSEYIISVAATKNGGDKAELVSFSNYGEETVDIAAPGTDILSTVSYDCFNPTLYGGDPDMFNETQDGNPAYLDGSASSIYEFAMTNMELTDQDVITSSSTAAFFSEDGLKVRFTSSQDKKWQYVAIPYSLPDNYSGENVTSSMMIKTLDGPQELTIDQYFDGTFSKVLLLDVPRSLLDNEDFLNKAGEDILMDYAYDYQIVAGDDDYWSHLTTDMVYQSNYGDYYINEGTDGATEVALDKIAETISKERALLILGDSQAGDFTAYIDDIGISPCLDDKSSFGKYDFYSGTSMATPYVAGAVALTAARYQDGDYSPEVVIGDVLSKANDFNPLKVKGEPAVSTEGTFDFANTNGFWVGVSSATVDISKKPSQIKLKGKFGGVDTLKITIDKDGETPVEITDTDDRMISKTDQEIILKDNGWINNIVDVTVEGTKEGKTKASTKRDIYLVKGKTNYTVFDEERGEIIPGSALTTDGEMIYAAQSAGDSITYVDPSDKYFETDEIAAFKKSYIKNQFTMAKNMSKTAEYDFRFGDDLVKIGNYFYVKGSFCEVVGSDWEDDDDWSHSKGLSSSDDDGDRFSDSNGAAYAEETYIFKVNANTGSISKVAWPKNSNADMFTDSKLAAYNGSLYLLGGMNESADPDEAFSDAVYCYDAAKNTWGNKAPLPEGRAGGKVLQTGNMLVYTLGYTAENEDIGSAPANYVFNGREWVEKTRILTPINPYGTRVSRGEAEYCNVSGSVGICRIGSDYGLVYIGIPVEDYGDTFVCNVNKDTYAGTDYNFTKDLDEVYDLYRKEKVVSGITVANRIIGFDSDSEIIGIDKAVTSGLVNVTGSIKNGSMTGKGAVMPGTSRTVKATTKPGYYVKSLKFAGAKTDTVAKGLKATAVVNKDVKAQAATAKVTVKSVNSLTLKRGKTASLNAKITPAAAAKQWKLAYKSSNTKYATVSAKGVVKATKKGKGKTVKIRVMLKGTNKVMKTVKVKIK